MTKIVMVAICAALMSCVGTTLSGFGQGAICSGPPLSWTDVQKIKPGMTHQQVADILEAPHSTVVDGDLVTATRGDVSGLTMRCKTVAVIFHDGLVSKAPALPSETK